MKFLPFSLGILVSIPVLYYALTADGATRATMHAGAVTVSYLAYSTLAFVLTNFGKQRKTKAWLFFACGIVLLFTYLPALDIVLGWIFYPSTSRDRNWLGVMSQLYFYAPLVVSALCIYRGISLWAEESLEQKAAQPTRPANVASRRG
ncbi:MAG: hypothetical protein JNN01_06370 [Opitutaceae bacterium]|nr:hypothetical protein [Opitutaceae bacterium]